MKWFRSNIKHGSRLALLALAIQFVVTFGHFHGIAAEAAPAIRSNATQAELSPTKTPTTSTSKEQAADEAPQPASNHDTDNQHGNDVCAICAVMALASSVLFAAPPLLLLPQAVEFLYQTTDAEFVHLDTFRIASQPRAPPAS